MTKEEAVALLKSDVAAWNEYRRKDPFYRPDLTGADLASASLAGADLRRAELRRAHLPAADLTAADLTGADLFGADLALAAIDGAVLTYVILSGAHLTAAHLKGAVLKEANLTRADLNWADLTAADLTRADLSFALLCDTDLGEANLRGASLNETVFASTNLSAVTGLDSCTHMGPSTIDHRTIVRSGMLPVPFLRGCGLPDDLIEYLPSLLHQPAAFCSCFISHSSKDQAIADRLYIDLQANGVRCWLGTENLKIGGPFRDKIDQEIRRRDKLLVILSEASVSSTWVADEVEAALEQEQRRKRSVLFPICLDDAVMVAEAAWAAKIRRQRHMGDFRGWKDHAAYQKAFDRFLRDLKPALERPAAAGVGE